MTMAHNLVRFTISTLWLQVHCQYVTQHPAISWSYVSTSVEMNCSHNRDAGHNQMDWYKQRPGESMTIVVYTSVGKPVNQTKYSAIKDNIESGALTVKNLQPEDSAVYFCAVSKFLGQTGGYEAHFGGGTKLTVLEYDVKEPTVEVFRPSSKQCLNLKSEEKEKTLLCVAKDFYPDHISVSWESGGVAVTTGVATDSFAARDGEFYKISSRLRVNAEDWYEKEYECIVTFFNGTNYNIHTAYIYGEEAPKDFHIREKYLRATQTAKLSYAVFIIKSSIYGAFVAFLVWKLKGSSGKQNG